MIALACTTLFAGAGALAVVTIVETVAPQRVRIVRLLVHGPEWSISA